MTLPDLVIFDCDGVIVDSERISHRVLQAMLAGFGVNLGFEQTVERFIGSSIPEMGRRVEALLARPLPSDFLQVLSQRTQEAFGQSLTPVPGVESVLHALRVPFCVASNGNRAKVDFTLGHTGLLPLFDGRIFTADDVQRPKPAPELFLHAAASMQAQPARTVVIEDTPTGVKAAKAAGMTVIGFAAMTPASRLRDAGADDVLVTMNELGSLLAARYPGAMIPG